MLSVFIHVSLFSPSHSVRTFAVFVLLPSTVWVSHMYREHLHSSFMEAASFRSSVNFVSVPSVEVTAENGKKLFQMPI